MANGTKVFTVAALMALVAISASQGQARLSELDYMPVEGHIQN